MKKRANNRTRFEIVHDILALCLSPQKQTQIMSSVRLSYNQTIYYLAVLLDNGLIESELRESVTDLGQTRYAKTTEKGRELLQMLASTIKATESIFETISKAKLQAMV
jgi:predicted transcriptional regulator